MRDAREVLAADKVLLPDRHTGLGGRRASQLRLLPPMARFEMARCSSA